jgi:PmbA protein
VILDIARFAVKNALEKGANEVEVYTGLSKELSVTYERNDVNIGKGHEMSGAAIRIFKNRSLGFASVNSFDRSDVEKAVDRALKLARTSPRDEFNELPHMKPLAKVEGLYDKESEHFSSEQALDYAGKIFNNARDFDGRITIDSCAFIADIGQHGVMNSSGIECFEQYSDFIYYISGMARDGDEVSNMDYIFDGTHQIKEIECEKLATEFAERIVKSLGAKKIESFKGSVLLSPFTCEELVGSLVAYSCNSNNVQKGSSRFMGMMGQEVASDTLTVKDDGTIPGGLGSSSFDREGLPHSPITLIDKGVLSGFMHNTYTANKEKIDSTSHATGDTRSLPGIEPTNLMIEPGTEGWQDIVSDIKKGVLVNRFSGFPQMISGDFSGIVKGGWLIENGELVKPVIETMIAGNIFELLKKVSQVSKERKKIMNYIMPYVRIDDVSVTGG